MNKQLTLVFLIITLFFTSCKDSEVSKTPKKETRQVPKIKKAKNYDIYLKKVASLLLTNGKNLVFSTGEVNETRRGAFDIQKIFLCDIKTDELITPVKVTVESIVIDQKSINNQAVIKGKIVPAENKEKFREFEVILNFEGDRSTWEKISSYELKYSEEQWIYTPIELL